MITNPGSRVKWWANGTCIHTGLNSQTRCSHRLTHSRATRRGSCVHSHLMARWMTLSAIFPIPLGWVLGEQKTHWSVFLDPRKQHSLYLHCVKHAVFPGSSNQQVLFGGKQGECSSSKSCLINGGDVLGGLQLEHRSRVLSKFLDFLYFLGRSLAAREKFGFFLPIHSGREGTSPPASSEAGFPAGERGP